MTKQELRTWQSWFFIARRESVLLAPNYKGWTYDESESANVANLAVETWIWNFQKTYIADWISIQELIELWDMDVRWMVFECTREVVTAVIDNKDWEQQNT